jgi:glutamyl-tRNA synthetase
MEARRDGGRVILRIEDLDASRARPWAIDLILTDLRWLGLDWEEGPDVGGPAAPYVQSQRKATYHAALERLKAEERVYPCTCTRADIARAASAPHADDEGPNYPGTCAPRRVADADRLGDRPFAWRFRVPPGPVVWHDRFLGTREDHPSRLGGDFVVGRSSGEPAYQLAVVADDAVMGVTLVLRGEDLVPSTPRQILLYDALGLEPPEFAHVPLVVGPDGRRLAKRDESIKLVTLREAGVDPRVLVGWLARSCGWSDRIEPSLPADWLPRSERSRLPRRPAVVPTHLLEELSHGNQAQRHAGSNGSRGDTDSA